MTRARHVKRRPLALRLLPAATAVCLVAVTVTAMSGSEDARPAEESHADPGFLGALAVERQDWQGVSRSDPGGRGTIVPARHNPEGEGVLEEMVPTPHGQRYLTADLNLWSGPGEAYELYRVVPDGATVAVTGVSANGYAQVIVRSRVGWVNSAYLTEDEPADPDESTDPDESADPAEDSDVSGVSAAPCPSGSGVESGLTPDAIRVHRAVCAAFPDVASYGGLRSDGEHAEGRALDIMVYSDTETGDAIADWVRAHAGELGVSEVLWAQHIWTVQRSSEGWRLFSDRGSATANHYDHVHVTVYGDAGG